MTLKLATLTLRREGQFYQLVGGEYHCGAPAALVRVSWVESNQSVVRDAKGGPAILVEYSLTVACGPTLDQRGFLFDQAQVDRWFMRQGLRVSSLSCEATTILLANSLMDKLAKDAPHCDLRGVTLQLSPAPHSASVSAHYVRE